MYLPSIAIVTAAAKDNANLVWAAMGRGPENFSEKLCAIDSGATHETPATHYVMSDASSLDSDVAEWQRMANGDLPAISGQWGQNGVIDSAAATEAVNAANLQVYSASGDVSPEAHKNSILAGRGLQVVPAFVFPS